MSEQRLPRVRRMLDAMNPYRDASAEDARKGRVVVLFTVICIGAASHYTALYLWLGLTLAWSGCAIAVALGTGTLVRFRTTGNLRRAAHLVASCAVIAVTSAVWATGGVTSNALHWFLIAPLIASLIAGRRIGALWLGIVGLAVGGIYTLELAGTHPSTAIPPDVARILDFTVPVGLILFSFAIGWTFDAASDEAEQRLAESRRAVLTARDEAELARDAAQAILDNVDQGLVLVDEYGSMQAAHSAPLRSWFGAAPMAMPVWALLEPHDRRCAEAIELGWEQLTAGYLPTEVALDQLPTRLETCGRVYELSWEPSSRGQVLLVATDVTAKRVARDERAEHEELLGLLARMSKNRASVVDFVADGRRLVDALCASEGTPEQERRWLHTLKGNSAVMGLERLSSWIHRLEGVLTEKGRTCAHEERNDLRAKWRKLEERFNTLVDSDDADVVRLSTDELDATLQMLAAGAPVARVAERMESWGWDDVESRLAHLGEQAMRIGQSLDKAVTVVADARGMRTPPTERWRALWSALIHLVRNAVDHGFETDRGSVGKEGTGLLELYAYAGQEAFCIEVRDDGAGIDWEALSRKVGRPLDTAAARIDCLFADGVSSRDSATTLSGRGVGTAAVRDAVEALEGTIEVDSERGVHTTFTLRIPAHRGTVGLCPVAANGGVAAHAAAGAA